MLRLVALLASIKLRYFLSPFAVKSWGSLVPLRSQSSLDYQKQHQLHSPRFDTTVSTDVIRHQAYADLYVSLLCVLRPNCAVLGLRLFHVPRDQAEDARRDTVELCRQSHGRAEVRSDQLEPKPESASGIRSRCKSASHKGPSGRCRPGRSVSRLLSSMTAQSNGCLESASKHHPGELPPSELSLRSYLANVVSDIVSLEAKGETLLIESYIKSTMELSISEVS